MKTLKFAIAVFYDKDLNIVVQERGEASKSGEKYAFWGGQMASGETPQEAVERELIEELNYRPEELEYWGASSFTIKEKGKYYGYKLDFAIFISPTTPSLMSSSVLEGKGLVKLPIENVIKEKGFSKGVAAFMPKLKRDLEQKVH